MGIPARAPVGDEESSGTATHFRSLLRAIGAQWLAMVVPLPDLLRTHAERAQAAGVGPDEARTWIRAADAEINDDLVPAGRGSSGPSSAPATPIRWATWSGRASAISSERR